MQDLADSMRNLGIDEHVLVSTLGMFIIDDIRLEDGEEMRGLIGGGGTYVVAGARLWLSGAQVGMIIDVGNDWEADWTASLQELDVTLHMRRDDLRKTTRAWNYYGPAEVRGFGYSTERKRIHPKDLHDIGWLQTTRALHFVCSPSRANTIMDQLEECLGEKLQDLWTIWEPIPDSCTPDNWDECKKAMKRVSIISPNHDEAAAFIGIKQDTIELTVINKVIDAFLLELEGGVIVLRCAHKGAYVANKMERRRIPAYYESEGGRHYKIVDVTGGGNSFLGGYMAGLIETNRDIFRAAVYGNVSASFNIEQYGLPQRDNKGWNGDDPRRRLAELTKRSQLTEKKNEDTPAVARLRSLLNEKFRVEIVDGRAFQGAFVCVDKEKNIILAGSEEFRNEEKRFVGLVMIPGKHIVKMDLLEMGVV